MNLCLRPLFPSISSISHRVTVLLSSSSSHVDESSTRLPLTYTRLPPQGCLHQICLCQEPIRGSTLGRSFKRWMRRNSTGTAQSDTVVKHADHAEEIRVILLQSQAADIGHHLLILSSIDALTLGQPCSEHCWLAPILLGIARG